MALQIADRRDDGSMKSPSLDYLFGLTASLWKKKKKDVTAYIRGSFVYGIMDPEGDSIPKIQLV